MLFTEVIRAKRDGGPLSNLQIQQFVDGLADHSLPAEQVSSLAMAILLNGMSTEEAGYLTQRMANSGTVLNWQHLPDKPVVDKHSTGGVGDKVSFLLAPIAAACGLTVPMIAGRGLGHTGGTVDKVEAIPGYNHSPSLDKFQQVVAKVGCAIIGSTPQLAPADRRLYAIRDITATVESVPLITASILSKKMAAGLQALVMDVKVGTGAFMQTLDDAQALVSSIIGTANAAGLTTHALITDMNETLGLTAGNALEIHECVRYLRNDAAEPRLDQAVRALCAQMLIVTETQSSLEQALAQVDQAITSGSAAEHFAHMVAELGGPKDFLDNHQRYLPQAPIVQPIFAEQAGYLASVNGITVGDAIIGLGGGRRRQEDVLDLAVGFAQVAPVGSKVGPDQPLAFVHAADQVAADLAIAQYQQACTLSDTAPSIQPVVHQVVTQP